jgi:hypothetical protein
MVGAVVGALLGLIVAPRIATDVLTKAWLLYAAIVVVLYVIATVGTPLERTSTGLITSSWMEQLARGAMIGLNATMNVFLLPAVVSAALPLVWVAAIVIGLIGILSAIPSLSNSPRYQAVLGWTGLAMPMAWPIHLLGALVWTINSLFSWAFPTRGFSDTKSATWVTHGGILYWPFPTPAAYNLGVFVQIPRFMQRSAPGQWLDSVSLQTANGLALHEGAHNLNVAAFGWWFHLIGFIHEQFLFGPGFVWPAGRFAYAELLAESRLRSARATWLAVWTSSLTPPAPGNIPPTLGTCDVIPSAPPAVGVRVDCVTIMPPVDPDGYVHPIGSLWILAKKPAGSAAAIEAPNTPNTWFIPDVPGTYTAALFITDGADGGRVPFVTSGTVIVE